jgi:mRNA interferase HigB
MPIITRKRLLEFAKVHPDAAEPLQKWERVVHTAKWQDIADVHRIYPHADGVQVASGNTVTVFNVKGNKYRLIAAIHYNRQRVYVLRLLRHSEYSKELWKKSL